MRVASRGTQTVRLRERLVVPCKAEKRPIFRADGTAGGGNLLHIRRAIDETMISQNYPSYMRNMEVTVSPEDSTRRGRWVYPIVPFLGSLPPGRAPGLLKRG